MSVFWWIKIGAGLGLVIQVVRAGMPGNANAFLFSPPVFWAQLAAAAGAGIHLYHYGLLKKANPDLSSPRDLLTRGGLFSRVRHPMYLGDLILMAGLLLLAPFPASVALWFAGFEALVFQSRIEDRYLETRFETSFREWKSRTGLLVPVFRRAPKPPA